MKKLFSFLVVAGLILGGSSIASAITLVDRGLPNANLNNAAGSSRSNVAWAEGGTQFDGDTFSIGTTGQSYVINSLTVWGVQHDPLSTDINNIGLYLGTAGDSLALLSSGSVTGNSSSNSNISFAFVNYPTTSTNYQGSSGGYIPIVETTFSGLNYVVQGGVTYNFGVTGDATTGNYWFNHASNAALSGTPQDGTDGIFWVFDTANLSSATSWDSTGPLTATGGGWDKQSDINVRIEGSQVPIPGAVWLLGSGLVGLIGLKRRSNKRDVSVS